MLDKNSDTDTIKEWLSAALKAAEQRGLTPADLARHCEVTPQAVNGWKKTGRIRKSHLAKAAEFFGHGPSFSGSPPQVRQMVHDWPFRLFTRRQFESLPSSERDQIERHALFIITDWERTRLEGKQGTTPPRHTARIYAFPKKIRDI